MKVKPLLLLFAVVGLLTLSSAANPATMGNSAADTGTAASSLCDGTTETKAKLYRKFLDNYSGDSEQQKVASEVGQEFISIYEGCPEESDKNVIGFVLARAERSGKTSQKYAQEDWLLTSRKRST